MVQTETKSLISTTEISTTGRHAGPYSLSADLLGIDPPRQGWPPGAGNLAGRLPVGAPHPPASKAVRDNDNRGAGVNPIGILLF